MLAARCDSFRHGAGWIEGQDQPAARTGSENGNEIDPAIVDHLEFYLLNYFKPGTRPNEPIADHGRKVFKQSGCASCHVADLTINHDRRVADVETVYDPVQRHFQQLCLRTATPLYQ